MLSSANSGIVPPCPLPSVTFHTRAAIEVLPLPYTISRWRRVFKLTITFHSRWWSTAATVRPGSSFMKHPWENGTIHQYSPENPQTRTRGSQSTVAKSERTEQFHFVLTSMSRKILDGQRSFRPTRLNQLNTSVASNEIGNQAPTGLRIGLELSCALSGHYGGLLLCRGILPVASVSIIPCKRFSPFKNRNSQKWVVIKDIQLHFTSLSHFGRSLPTWTIAYFNTVLKQRFFLLNYIIEKESKHCGGSNITEGKNRSNI